MESEVGRVNPAKSALQLDARTWKVNNTAERLDSNTVVMRFQHVEDRDVRGKKG